MNYFSPAIARQADRLTDLPAFGTNPGKLQGWTYIPADLPLGAPLVVVLHGCTQTAAGYDAGTGWSTLADRGGFALLFPEQARANNPNLCFNWFNPADTARVGGEAESIAQMVRATVAAHALDAGRVFVTGLSAGGAMTAAMLATYPELFAAGAIIGGLPYGSASGVPEAMARMRGDGGANDARLVATVRQAPSGGGEARRWPAVSIWHGTADATVNATNMAALGRQWRGVHEVVSDPETTAGPGWSRRAWSAGDRVVVEEWSIPGMGHGVPIDPRGVEGLGVAGAFMLDVGVASTALIARGWGIIPAAPIVADRPAVAAKVEAHPPAFAGVRHTIETALRSAGLMR